MRLHNRSAIVTGAASGIGRATAQIFLREGAKVLAVDLPGRDLALNLVQQDNLTCLEQSVSGEAAAEAIIAAALSAHGALDILVNNAGIAHSAPIEAMKLEDFDRVIDINLRSHFLLARQAIPALRRSKFGRIINIASVMAVATDYGLGAYCASKAGVAGLTRSLALELGRDGITANYILPGAIKTAMTRATFDQPDLAQVWAKKSPLKRLGEPEDIARAILFLASDEAGFITGHGLNVDGGLLLRT